MKIFSVFAFALFLWLPTQAATINAASCSSSDVQTAINSASTGDTVAVPAGSCTWTTTVSFISKGITLQGAGIGVTNIDDQGSGGAAIDIFGLSAADFVRVTGFTWIADTSHPSGMVTFNGADGTNAGEIIGFRFDHNRVLAGPGTTSRGIFVTAIMGLLDNNIFDITATSGSHQVISVAGSGEGE